MSISRADTWNWNCPGVGRHILSSLRTAKMFPEELASIYNPTCTLCVLLLTVSLRTKSLLTCRMWNCVLWSFNLVLPLILERVTISPMCIGHLVFLSCDLPVHILCQIFNLMLHLLLTHCSTPTSGWLSALGNSKGRENNLSLYCCKLKPNHHNSRRERASIFPR